LIGAVTYIDLDRRFHVYKFDLIHKFGCPKNVCSRLNYVRTMIERLFPQSDSARPGSLSSADARIRVPKRAIPSYRISANSPH
uniref:PIPK domain-containing protein n=1 Tax=Toxocara canis TaxID=6265 RepID=A0A183VCD8_TOXCA